SCRSKGFEFNPQRSCVSSSLSSSSSSYSLGTLPVGVQCTINHFFPHLFHLLILSDSVYLSGTIPGYHLAILSLVFLFFPFRPLTPASHSLSFARSPFYICIRTG